MAQKNFTVVINLSNYFSDHRHKARIYINEEIKTVHDFQLKISEIFGIQNFILTSQNEYLPQSEDVRILRSDDIIWITPSTHDKVDSTFRPLNETTSSKRRHFSTPVAFSVKESTKKKSKLEVQAVTTEISEQNEQPKLKHKRSKNKESTEEISLNLIEPIPKKKKKCKRVREHPSYDKIVEENKDSISKIIKQSNNENIEEFSKRYKEVHQKVEARSKKNKKNDFEEKQTSTNNLIEENILNSDIKETSKHAKSSETGTNMSNDFQVKIGNSLPKIVSVKRSSPLPTITDQYLKEKKINIVKIDYISKPLTAENELNLPEDRSIEETVEKEALSPEINISETNYNVGSAEGERNTNEFKEKQEIEVLENVETTAAKEVKKLEKPPTTKYFFINTPTSKERREKEKKPVNKQKKGNVFKLPDALRLTLHVPKIVVPENSLTENITTTDTENIMEVNGISDNITETQTLTNENNSSNIYNQDTNVITYSNPEDSTLESSAKFELFNTDVSTCKNISQSSPCLTTILKTPVEDTSDLGMSGLQVINYGNKSFKKHLFGVGTFLETFRKSRELVETNSEILADENIPESPLTQCSGLSGDSEFVTKRKRNRVRKRKAKSRIELPDESLTPKLPTPRPAHINSFDSCPSLHITFDDDGNKIETINHNEGEKLENGHNDDESSIVSVNSEITLSEENILKAPLMTDMTPKLNDIIAFKIVKLSEKFTPEVSSYIVANVRKFLPETRMITLEIIAGIQHFGHPNGKSSALKTCFWSELIEPRLIYP